LPEEIANVFEIQEINGEVLISLGTLDDRIQHLMNLGIKGGPAIILAEAIKQLAAKVQAERRHVLVFGTTGSGKTTLLNNLTGQNYATGNQLKGVTFCTTTYPVVARNDVEYIFHDTIGLNGPSLTVSSTSGENSIQELTELLIKHKQGLHLVIMVLKQRLTTQTTHNYVLFYEKIMRLRVPLLIVVTGWEDELEEQKTLDDVSEFSRSNIKVYKEIIAVGFAKHKVYENIRAVSEKKVWESIEKHCPKSRINFIGDDVIHIIEVVWESFRNALGLPNLHFRRPTTPSVEELLNVLQLPPNVSIKLAAKIRKEFNVK